MTCVALVLVLCVPLAGAISTWLVGQGRTDPLGVDRGKPIDASNVMQPDSDLNITDYNVQLDKQLKTRMADSVFDSFILNTTGLVEHWKVVSAIGGDRVAVTIFQPADVDKFAYIIRSNMKRLGPKWALQVFYGKESDRASLSRALGDPEHVIWSPLEFAGKRRFRISHSEASWFRMSTEFWEQISEAHEHVLIFESDSLLLKTNGCVDKYLSYDYVGAPWSPTLLWHPPPYGGNGGFVLRRRSSGLKAASQEEIRSMLNGEPRDFPFNEDVMMVEEMYKLHMNFPDREDALCFCAETENKCDPCAIHKVWEHFNDTTARDLLNRAYMFSEGREE